jgi:hypothetical protein
MSPKASEGGDVNMPRAFDKSADAAEYKMKLENEYIYRPHHHIIFKNVLTR